MKNLYLLLLLIFSFQSVSATHIIGGTISYEYLGGDEYKIRLEVLRDCFNGQASAYFDTTASIGVFDINEDLVAELLVPFSGIDDTLSLNVPNNVCIFPSNICVHKTIYETNVNLPDIPGGYTIAYQRCCRSEVISNLESPLNNGMTFHSNIITSYQNSSPQYNNDVPFAVFANTPFVYDGSATDLEGDSLVYELTTPFYGADQAIPMPQPPYSPPYTSATFLSPYEVNNMLGGNYPLTINPSTGEMTAIPPNTGVFQIAYAIKEFRNDILIGTSYREFTFVVISSNPGQNYDISGSVLINGTTPLDEGKVQIIERDITTDSLFVYEEQVIGLGAEYAFEGIPAGVFYVKGIIDSTSIYYDNYLPTYYNSAAFWYNATPINQCDTSQLFRDIHLMHVDSLTGMILLDGIVSHAGRSFDPVSSLNLILGDENGELVQTRTTNDNGYFKFENLVPGTYQLYADLINSSVDNLNPPIIELSENTSIEIYLYEDSLSLQTPTTSIHPLRKPKAYVASIFPNPANDKIQLEIDAREPGVFTAKIVNLYGQYITTIFENQAVAKGKFSKEVHLKQFSSGVYFIAIKNKNRSVFQKIVIQQ